MYNCIKCSKNSWTFTHLPTGKMEAVCKNCGHKFQWTLKPKSIIKEGSPCRKCNTPVILKQALFSEKKLLRPFYYTAYYYCPNCKAMYHNNKFKKFNNQKTTDTTQAKLI